MGSIRLRWFVHANPILAKWCGKQGREFRKRDRAHLAGRPDKRPTNPRGGADLADQALSLVDSRARQPSRGAGQAAAGSLQETWRQCPLVPCPARVLTAGPALTVFSALRVSGRRGCAHRAGSEPPLEQRDLGRMAALCAAAKSPPTSCLCSHLQGYSPHAQ